MEGALKLKEIGYLHAEGYSGGALKHGPFAMIESDENGKTGATPIVRRYCCWSSYSKSY